MSQHPQQDASNEECGDNIAYDLFDSASDVDLTIHNGGMSYETSNLLYPSYPALSDAPAERATATPNSTGPSYVVFELFDTENTSPPTISPASTVRQFLPPAGSAYLQPAIHQDTAVEYFSQDSCTSLSSAHRSNLLQYQSLDSVDMTTGTADPTLSMMNLDPTPLINEAQSYAFPDTFSQPFQSTVSPFSATKKADLEPFTSTSDPMWTSASAKPSTWSNDSASPFHNFADPSNTNENIYHNNTISAIDCALSSRLADPTVSWNIGNYSVQDQFGSSTTMQAEQIPELISDIGSTEDSSLANSSTGRGKSISWTQPSDRNSRLILRPMKPKPSIAGHKSQSASPQESLMPSISCGKKGKRKRSLSPSKTPSGIPTSYLCSFRVELDKDREREERPNAVLKRVQRKRKNQKACLRCQFHSKRCSGTFPCTSCLSLFVDKAKKHSTIMVQWTSCIDSDILDFNFHLKVHLCFQQMDDVFLPQSSNISSPSSDAIRHILRVIGILIHGVRALRIEAGFSHLLVFQIYRTVAASVLPRASLAPPIFWMMRQLPRRALRLWEPSLPLPGEKCSFAWIYAVVVLHPKLILRCSGVNAQEFQSFSVEICRKFYADTAYLLRKAKNSNWRDRREEWLILNENLTAIYLINTYHSHRVQLGELLHWKIRSLRASPELVAVKNWIDEFLPKLKSNWEAIPNVEETLPMLRERSAMHRPWKDLWKAATNEKGRSHLARFALHWLEKLNEGPDCYPEVLQTILDLNTMCRVDLRRDCEPIPRSVDTETLEHAFEEAYDLIRQSYTTAKEEGLAKELKELAKDLFKFLAETLLHLEHCHESGDIVEDQKSQVLYQLCSELPITTLRNFEKLIAKRRAENESTSSKLRKLQPPRDISDEACGSTECDCSDGICGLREWWKSRAHMMHIKPLTVFQDQLEGGIISAYINFR